MGLSSDALVDFVVGVVCFASNWVCLVEGVVLGDLAFGNEARLAEEGVLLDNEQTQALDTLEGVEGLPELHKPPVAHKLDQALSAGRQFAHCVVGPRGLVQGEDFGRVLVVGCQFGLAVLGRLLRVLLRILFFHQL